MLIDTIFMREDHVILRDVDGSEVSLTAIDAQYVYEWVQNHMSEVLAAMYHVAKEKEKHNGFDEV